MDILLLEDDTLLAQSVIDELEDASYSVAWVQESEEVIEMTFQTRFKLYLFDVNVPGMNGFELLKSLRESGDKTPALFMTSRNQIEDIQQGFRVGADDYIKKPFDLDELLVRIEAKMPHTAMVHFSKDFSIDISNVTITCKNATQTLPAKEFDILNYLCAHQEQLISAESIIDALYDDIPISIATFRTYIKNLKRHIDGCAMIENVKGVGYRLRIL
jgi:DNA-binding response OmpR family regulator